MPALWPGTPELQHAPAPRPEPHLARHRRCWQRWQRSIQTERNGLQQFSFRRRYPTILDDTVGAGCDDIFFNRCDNPSSSKRHSRRAQPLSPPAGRTWPETRTGAVRDPDVRRSSLHATWSPLTNCRHRLADSGQRNETFGASRAAGISSTNSCPARKLNMPAMTLEGNCSRRLL